MFKSFTLNLTRFIYYVRNPAKKAASEVETAFLKSYLTRDSNPEPID